MTMRLIITRHGETEENRNKIIQGHLPGTLSENGLMQAERVALRLKDEPISHIFSSDLARAANTATIIAKYHSDTPLEFTQALRERYLGAYQGKTRTELKKQGKPIKPVDGESDEKMYVRAEKFLHEVLKAHQDKTVLFVAHNGINKALISAIKRAGHERIWDVEKQHNTAVNIFEIDEDRNHNIILLNDKTHLDQQ